MASLKRPFKKLRPFNFGRVWIVLLFLLLLFSAPAVPVDFTVTTTADTVDINPGDGICTDILGMCSLRAAVQESNDSVQVDDIILPAGTYLLALPGPNEDFSATGDLDILNNLNIEGADATLSTIENDTSDRLFHVKSGVSVSICRVSIRHGVVLGDGGGILNSGKLMLMSTILSDNTSVGSGGGIANSGTQSRLTILQSTISGNSAFPAESNQGTNGGGIANFNGELQINLSVINNNVVVGNGAGIFNFGQISIRNSTIANNETLAITETEGGRGGGFSNRGFGFIDTTTIEENTGHDGGGIYNLGSLDVTNSTISGNHSPAVGVGTIGSGGHGGGLFNATTGVFHILNTTIAENTAAFPSGGEGIANLASATMRNSIIANDCSTLISSQPITSQGNNIQIDHSCGLAAASDITANPLLGPLADNAGPTRTHELLAGSPAINSANQCPVTDQRLFIRPLPCDRGSYEKGLEADLAVVKNVDCDSVKVGNELNFQLIAANFGPVVSEDVQLIDILPSGLSFIAAQPSQGACDRPIVLRNGDTLLRCDLGSIDPDGTATVDVEVQATDPGVLINTGTLSSRIPEKQFKNNTSSTRVRVRRSSTRE